MDKKLLTYSTFVIFLILKKKKHELLVYSAIEK